MANGAAAGVLPHWDLLAGYEKLQQMGTGARSIIYKARETRTGEIRAVKHVVRRDEEDDRFLVQAEVEHEICSRLQHKHLRHSFSIHRVRKWARTRELYIVMEYIEGMTFEQAKPNRLDWFLQIMRKVAEGLDALHEIGYVHADIKPNNIILGKNGVVKIIDFGQSCRIGQRKERIQGTPEYIAPEQVKRWPLQRSTDVFNLGATMYWLLTEKPFPTGVRQSPAGLGVDLAGPQQALTPKQINAKIPPALSQLVMDCCREIPSERPADMKQVLARLDVVQRMWRRQQIALKNQRTTSREAKGIALQNRRSATEQQHE